MKIYDALQWYPEVVIFLSLFGTKLSKVENTLGFRHFFFPQKAICRGFFQENVAH